MSLQSLPPGSSPLEERNPLFLRTSREGMGQTEIEVDRGVTETEAEEDSEPAGHLPLLIFI